VKPGVDKEAVRQKLAVTFANLRRDELKGRKGLTQKHFDEFVNAPLRAEPAAAGVSGLQKDYRRSLVIPGALVVMLLLIACANVANLMMAQATARAREMALRIAIGAGRGRLVQLVMVESTLMAVTATLLGGLFAWWSAPWVVSLINPPDNPARLILPADGRVPGFASALTAAVIFLFGLAPALRASSMKPMTAIRGGDDAHSRRRLMNGLVAAQVAFCFLVHFVAGLFVTTFDRLSAQPTGFNSERLLTLETVVSGDRPYEEWEQIRQHLGSIPGVTKVAWCGWAPMSGNTWASGIKVAGQDSEGDSPYFLGISPGWMDTMEVPIIAGRDFRPGDAQFQVAMANEAFAKRYFQGQNPVGKSYGQTEGDQALKIEIVGLVRDARYRNMREAIRPTVYVPMRTLDQSGNAKKLDWATYMVRTASPDPATMAATLRTEVARQRPDFRVSNIITQKELVASHTVRERLLAMLSLFFASVALVLAGVGLYGVLNYSVLQRQKEIGIRMALGANASDVAVRVTAEVFAMLALGSGIGLTVGIASERYVESLLFQVKTTDWLMVTVPLAAILGAGLLAALPPVIAAVRVDPATVLRAE